MEKPTRKRAGSSSLQRVRTGAARRWRRATSSLTPNKTPLLSIVVVASGATEWNETFESLQALDSPAIEFLVSQELAASLPRKSTFRDRRWQVVTDPVGQARGTWLWFVDPRVCARNGAANKLLTALPKSTADMVSARVALRTAFTKGTPAHQRQSHASAMRDVNRSLRPDLAWGIDPAATVVRREFWSRSVTPSASQRVKFLEAVALGERVDVERMVLADLCNDFSHDVALEQVRGDLSSLAASPARDTNVDRFVRARLFERELWDLCRGPGVATGELAQLLTELIREHWRDDCAGGSRFQYWASAVAFSHIARQGLDANPVLLEWWEQPLQFCRTEVQGDELVLVPPLPLDVGAETLRVSDRIGLVTALTEIHATEDGVTIRGFAYIPLVSNGSAQEITLELLGADGTAVPLPVERRSEIRAALAARDRWHTMKDSGFSAKLTAAALRESEWVLRATVAAGPFAKTSERWAAHADLLEPRASGHFESHGALEVTLEDSGRCVVRTFDPQPASVAEPAEDAGTLAVQFATANGSEWSFAGIGVPDASGELVLVDQSGREISCGQWVSDEDGQWQGNLDVAEREGSTVRSLPSGSYQILAKTGLSTLPLRWKLPADTPSVRSAVSLSSWSLHRDAEQSVELRAEPLSHGDERSQFQQAELARKWFGKRPEPIVPGSVFLSTFDGRSVSCHPAAIGRALLEHRQTGPVYADVADGAVAVPEGFTPVLRGTEEWHKALATSAVVISNTALPDTVTIAPEQFYLQTWHGTPLKRIGRDIQRVVMSRRFLVRSDLEAATMWDGLLSTSPFTTEVLPTALGYSGRMYEFGSPRLDELVRDHSFARERVRARYGIDDSRRVVLYAPTWRDGGGVSEILDLDAVCEQVGSDVVVLVRAHPNVLGRAAKRSVDRGKDVVDVSRHPVIEELYSAADLLVTDYSSTLFDFAVTGRPIILHTPDLDLYRDGIRGFYTDLEHMAPGPVVRTSEEVIELLRKPDAELIDPVRREQFAEQFLPWEDGHASERAAATVIETLGQD